MMKKLKFLALPLALIAMLGFASCSSDDDGGSSGGTTTGENPGSGSGTSGSESGGSGTSESGSGSSETGGSGTTTDTSDAIDASKAADYIRSLTGDATVKIKGSMAHEVTSSFGESSRTENYFFDIEDALEKSSYKIALDLSQTSDYLEKYFFGKGHYKNVISLVLPENFTTFYIWGEHGEFDNLESITLPKSLTEVNNVGSTGFPALKKVYISDLAAFSNIVERGANSSISSPSIFFPVTKSDDENNSWAYTGSTELYLNNELVETLTLSDDVKSKKAFSGCASIKTLIVPGTDSSYVTGDSFAENYVEPIVDSFTIFPNLTKVVVTGEIENFGAKMTTSREYSNRGSALRRINGIVKYSSQKVTLDLSQATPPSETATYHDVEYNFLEGLGSRDEKFGIFSSASNLESILLPTSGSYSIPDKAFFETGLTSIIIPDSVTSIGDNAFGWCKSLASVTIGSGVTSIGDNAFSHCTSLASITIPESNIESMGGYVFTGCDSVTSMTVGSGKVVRLGLKSLTNVTLGDGVTSIESGAFSGCKSLASVTIPDSVTSIGDKAFSSCTSLASVTIPDSVTSIGEDAFYNCTSLASVTIGSGVTSIGKNAFYNCTSLASVTIPDSVTSIGDKAFCYCTSLASITIPESNIESMGESVFTGCDSVTSMTVGSGKVVSLGLKSLTNVTLGDGVTSIESGAFSGCKSLASVTIPDSVTSIGEYAFSSCTSLASVTIGSGVTSIGEYAFYKCTSLASITIPASVTSIGDGAFAYCGGLTADNVTFEVTTGWKRSNFPKEITDEAELKEYLLRNVNTVSLTKMSN